MFVNRIIRRNQDGDTIVEVLIAIAVVSSVLAITYATMNRNITVSRASQERSEASKLAQGQLEALKAKADASNSFPSSSFCIDSNGDSVDIGGNPDSNLQIDDLTKYATVGCVSSNGVLHYAIMPEASNTYRFYVRWDKIGGGKDEIIMVYKL